MALAALVLWGAFLGLSGCGQMGPLTLPGDPAGEAEEQAGEAEEPRDDDGEEER
jgi:predicted small lipoprotein YifL